MTFVATNLTSSPITRASVREQTVLVINGRESADSGLTFMGGPHPGDLLLQPGRSQMFGFRLMHLFAKPGVYRLVWKGKDFETLPIEFRVVDPSF